MLLQLVKMSVLSILPRKNRASLISHPASSRLNLVSISEYSLTRSRNTRTFPPSASISTLASGVSSAPLSLESGGREALVVDSAW